jgi:transcriptional regulator with XRE-family HTH domain
VELGAIIKQKRTNQCLSLRALSSILDIDKGLLCLYENGKRNVSKNHIEVVESYLDGDYDKEILKLLLDELYQKYEHLAGKRGLQLWGM